jgi:hypothetical protein
MWFCDPKTFNDPFDTQTGWDFGGSLEDIIQHIKRNSPETPVDVIHARAKVLLENKNIFKESYPETFDQFINMHSFYCLAGKGDNLLMWAHYSDNHKGVCLKFDILKDIQTFSIPIKINYDDNYPMVNPMFQNNDFAKLKFFTKSVAWEYENEYRLIRDVPPGYQSFLSQCLVEVIFGCKVDLKEIDSITKMVRTKYPHVIFTKAVKSKSGYNLNFETLD